MRSFYVSGLLVVLLLAGCRGHQSDRPPIHPNLDMDFQEKFQPQSFNPLFEDNATMRPPVPGTVPRGQIQENSALQTGRTPNGEYVDRVPIAVNRKVLERGQDRYEIFCAPCHGKTGAGNGIIMRGNYGYPPASSYHIDRLRDASDGYLYDVISNGVRNMPAYGHQVSVRDRWAIVTYIRALQRSQNAGPEEIPDDVAARIRRDTTRNGSERASRENTDRQRRSSTAE